MLAGFFFMIDKQAKDSHLTMFNFFRLNSSIPPKGINFCLVLIDRILNLFIPRKPFLNL